MICTLYYLIVLMVCPNIFQNFGAQETFIPKTLFKRIQDKRTAAGRVREDKIEEMVAEELKKLFCPSPKIIDWVANAMREQYKDSIEDRERHISNLQGQLKRISAMDETLYDDKLAEDKEHVPNFLLSFELTIVYDITANGHYTFKM